MITIYAYELSWIVLASAHFGNNGLTGRLARYADTDGVKDFYRPHAWRWRDWVIVYQSGSTVR
jgi:hypothetical protein